MQGNMGMGGGPGGGMGGMGGGPGGMNPMNNMGPGGGMGGMGGGMPNMMGPMGNMGNMMGNPMMNPMMGMGGMGDGSGMFPMGMGMGMDMPMGGMNAMAMGGMPGMMGKGPMMPPGGPKGGGMGGPPKGGMGGGGGGMKPPGLASDKYCHKFYNSGTCDYGDNCKYAHIRPDGRQFPVGGGGGGGQRGGAAGGGAGGGVRDTKQSAHKTRMCPQFSDKGFCKYGDSCTFAHDASELRRGDAAPGGAPMMPPMMGGPPPNAPGRPGNAPKQGGGGSSNGAGNKRAFDAGGNDAKRQRTAVPVPPSQESLPVEGSLGIHDLQQKFEALKAEAARFAVETGHTVAIFTVGGIISEAPESTADDYEGETYVKGVNASQQPDLKLSVLKYGTGGVCKQLTTRPEIVKFVCARGTKALSEIAAAESLTFNNDD